MFSLFEKEIPKARPEEGEGSGGKRLNKQERKRSREIRRNRKKRTVSEDDAEDTTTVRSFTDLSALIKKQNTDLSNNKEDAKALSQELTKDVAERIVSKTNGSTLTKEDLDFISGGNNTKNNSPQKRIEKTQKEESAPMDMLVLFKKGDISALQQEEGRWKKLSDIKNTIQRVAKSAGYSPKEVDQLFTESINPIATQIWEELQGDKNNDTLNTLHTQFLDATKEFLQKEPQSTTPKQTKSTPKKDTIETTKETSQETQSEVLPQSDLVRIIEKENPQMYGNKGNIHVQVGGDFNGTVGHGSSVGGNIEMKKVVSESSGEGTIQEKSPRASKKSSSTSHDKADTTEAPVPDTRQGKQNQTAQKVPLSKQEQKKIKAYKKQMHQAEAFSDNALSQADYDEDDMTAYEEGYVKTQERREYTKGKRKGQEYVVDKWIKNKVDPVENLSNFSRDIASSIESYRQKLGYGDDTISKQQGTPRYRALLAVNQLLLENGKLTEALDANADEEKLQNIVERIIKNKQKVEEVLQMPVSLWDDVDDLKGMDVYKNMKEQLATAKYDVAGLLKDNPEVEDTPEYKVYQQFIEKIQPLMQDEQTMYDSHILVRTTLDSISRQVDAMMEKYTSNTNENNDVSVFEEESDTSIGEYTEPDESLLRSQEEWRQVLSDGIDVNNGDSEVAEEEVNSDNTLDTRRNQELAKDDPDGLFAWGENQRLLFGMQVPKAGPEDVFSVRAYAQALRLLEGRVLPELQKDPQKRKQYNEILQIVTNVPDTGLTSQEIERLSELTQAIAMPESPLQLDTGRTVDAMYEEAEKKVQEKLSSLATKKKKRGFFGRLVRAAVLSLPFIATATALYEKSPPQKVEAMSTAPTLNTNQATGETAVDGVTAGTQDSEVSRQIPAMPQVPSSESVASIPPIDVTEMVTSSDVSVGTQQKVQIKSSETIEKLKDYTVRKNDNLTFIIEGKTEGGTMLPALQAIPEAQREHILNHVITALRYSPEKQREMGVQSGNVDLIYPGDVINLEKLNELITQVAKDQGVNVVQQ